VVKLTFSGALSEAASQPSNYAVSVNGTAVLVQRVDITDTQVTLQLARSLQSNDEIVVAWRNLPGSGETQLVTQ
jgi:hypothetical protein